MFNSNEFGTFIIYSKITPIPEDPAAPQTTIPELLPVIPDNQASVKPPEPAAKSYRISRENLTATEYKGNYLEVIKILKGVQKDYTPIGGKAPIIGGKKITYSYYNENYIYYSCVGIVRLKRT